MIVNGQGPQRSSDNQGEGYGGGGGAHYNGSQWIRDGLPGVILMEVVKGNIDFEFFLLKTILF